MEKNEKFKNSIIKEDKQEKVSEKQHEQDVEIGGYVGQEPTTHGDWQHKGRVSDF